MKNNQNGGIKYNTTDGQIRENMEKLQQENDEKQKIIMRFEQIIKETKGISIKWQKEIQEKTNEISEIKNELTKTKLAITYLNEQRRLILESNRSSLDKIKEIQESKITLTKKEPTFSDMIKEKSQNSNESQDLQISTLKKDLEFYKQELAKIKEKLASSENELKSKINEMRKNAEKFIKENISLKEQIAQFDKIIKSQKTRILELENEGRLKIKSETLQHQLLEYEKTIANLNDKIASIGNIDLMRSKYEELQGQVTKIEKIAKELISLPEIKTVYEIKMKGKDCIQQIACSIDHFLKIIRVFFDINLKKKNRIMQEIIFLKIISKIILNIVLIPYGNS